jgi:hypothetical protein
MGHWTWNVCFNFFLANGDFPMNFSQWIFISFCGTVCCGMLFNKEKSLYGKFHQGIFCILNCGMVALEISYYLHP